MFDDDHYGMDCDDCGENIQQSLHPIFKDFEMQRNMCARHADRVGCNNCGYTYSETTFPSSTFKCPMCDKVHEHRLKLFVKAVELVLLMPYVSDEWSLPPWRKIYSRSIPAYLRLLERSIDANGGHLGISMNHVRVSMKTRGWEASLRAAVAHGQIEAGADYVWRWSNAHNGAIPVSVKKMTLSYKRTPRPAYWGPIQDQPSMTEEEILQEIVKTGEYIREGHQMFIEAWNAQAPAPQRVQMPRPIGRRAETVQQRLQRITRQMTANIEAATMAQVTANARELRYDQAPWVAFDPAAAEAELRPVIQDEQPEPEAQEEEEF